MITTEVKIGSKLYFTDTKDYFGEVIKVRKYTVWVKEPNGNIEKKWLMKFAKKMLNK